MKLTAVTNEVLPDTAPGALTRIFDAAARAGVTTFELRTCEGRRFPAIEPDTWERLKSGPADFGIRYSAVSPGLFKAPLRSDLVSVHADQFLSMTLDLAERLFIDTLIVFAPMRDARDTSADLARVVDLLGDAVDIAARRGFAVQLENLPGSWADTSDACLALLEGVNRPGFGYVWDTGNLFEAEGGAHFAAGLEKLRPHIRNVHMKDGRIIDGRMVWQRYGQGLTDVKGQLAALKAMGFDGTLVLEAACHPHEPGDFDASLGWLKANL